MKLRPLNIRTAGISAVLFAVVLNGCTNTGSQFTSAAVSMPQNIATANVHQLIRHIEPKEKYDWACFVSWPPPQICWLKPNGDIICITAYYNLPHYGITGPASGRWFYVGSDNGTVAVLKYTNGQWAQVGTISGLSGNPVGMATDSHGNLWVTNTPTTTISEFTASGQGPIATYTDPNLSSVNYLALDKNNNVYIEGSSASAMEIDKLTPNGVITVIGQPGKVGTTPGGLAVQNHGSNTYVWVNDQGYYGYGGRISRYVLKGSVGLISTGSFTYSGVNGAIALAPSDTKHVYAVNNVPSGSQFVSGILEYAFPSGTVVYSYPTSTIPFESVAVAILRKL